MLHHPDRSEEEPGLAAQKFQAIQNAYEAAQLELRAPSR
eukprot:SAG31_NODE_7438_length_1689_cov_1.199371_1_plen_39_part_00